MIPIWLIVAVVILLVIVILTKSMNHIYFLAWIRQNFFYFFVIGILLFVSYSFFVIYATNNLDLGSYEGFARAANVYFVWLRNVFSNMAKVTGYVISQDWTNATAG